MASSRRMRLRVFAGPNGSGKSTITQIIKKKFDLGVYVNADEIKKLLQDERQIDFEQFHIVINRDCFVSLFRESPLSKRADVEKTLEAIDIHDNILYQKEGTEVEDYFVSFIASYIRNSLLETSQKFTFETVMSHPSKLEEMRLAKDHGYKVYLYFVTLASPQLNKLRVQTRVSQGGHDVDGTKIEERYYRTMDLLFDAVKLADNAYLFDNSFGEHKLIAQKENGKMSVLVEYVPEWFQTYLIDKLD